MATQLMDGFIIGWSTQLSIFSPNIYTLVSVSYTHLDLKTVGLKASPTNVFKSFTPKPKGEGQSVEGDSPKEKAKNLISMLKEKHII